MKKFKFFSNSFHQSHYFKKNIGMSVAEEQATRWRERVVGKGNKNTPTCLGTISECASTQSTFLFGGIRKKAEENQKKKRRGIFFRKN